MEKDKRVIKLMKIKHAFKIVISVFISYLIAQASLSAAELKNATLRDENISALELTVEYFIRQDGLMEYVYKIDNPLINLGEVSRLVISLECSVNFEQVTLPYASKNEGYTGDHTLTKSGYSPVAIKADYGSSGIYGITINKEAHWGLASQPGEFVNGLRLISPAKPGMRAYTITPWVDYSEGGWELPDDINLVPKAYDFAISGMIAGPGCPGCPGVTEHPDVALFAGSGHNHEKKNINKLLQYGNLDKNRFHVDKGTKEVDFHIYYNEDVDAKTFKVKPEYLKNYFNPVAGTNEKVTLPLKKYRNKIKLSVHSLKKDKNEKSKYAYEDTDKFEIRVSGGHKKHD